MRMTKRQAVAKAQAVFLLLSVWLEICLQLEELHHHFDEIGKIFVLRNDHRIIGMVNTLTTISTAEGGFVLLLEDFFIHPSHRSQGFGRLMLDYVIDYAKKKDFKRTTLLTDKISEESQKFFQANGFSFSQMIPMRFQIGTSED